MPQPFPKPYVPFTASNTPTPTRIECQETSGWQVHDQAGQVDLVKYYKVFLEPSYKRPPSSISPLEKRSTTQLIPLHTDSHSREW